MWLYYLFMALLIGKLLLLIKLTFAVTMFRQHREQERLAEERAEEEALLYLQEAWAQGEILSSEPEGGWCDWERKED